MTVARRRSVASELPHEPFTALHATIRHGLSERTNDVSQILPTVSSWDQHFALLHPTPDGRLDLRHAFDPAAVREFYEDRVRTESLITSHGMKDVGSSWYRLVDTKGVFRLVETGEERSPRVVVLFPTWTDGIIGENMWTEPDGAAMPKEWRTEGELGHLLESVEAAWRSGDTSARLAAFDDETCSVFRVAELGGDHRWRAVARTKSELAATWTSADAGRVIELERTSRVVTHFYVFAAYRAVLQLTDRKVEREVAALFPVSPSGRFYGELSYAFEVRLDD